MGKVCFLNFTGKLVLRIYLNKALKELYIEKIGQKLVSLSS